MKKLITVLIFAAVSFGPCFGGQRVGKCSSFSKRNAGYENNISEVFVVQEMLGKIFSSKSKRVSLEDAKNKIEAIKDRMVDAYIDAMRAKDGQSSSDSDCAKYIATYDATLKYITSFDAALINVYTEKFYSLLESTDPELDQAINLLATRHVAVQAGARGLPTVQRALARAFNLRGYDDEESSSLVELLKTVGVIVGVAGVATLGAYGAYRYGWVNKEGKEDKGFLSWVLNRDGTRFFSFDKKEEPSSSTTATDTE
ncbi:hypothetical protein KKA53_04250 [Candidatus Dependentiae bacterium]|nr:hypothetical protein [Candidatus Dependentiae bacterium]